MRSYKLNPMQPQGRSKTKGSRGWMRGALAIFFPFELCSRPRALSLTASARRCTTQPLAKRKPQHNDSSDNRGNNPGPHHPGCQPRSCTTELTHTSDQPTRRGAWIKNKALLQRNWLPYFYTHPDMKQQMGSCLGRGGP